MQAAQIMMVTLTPQSREPEKSFLHKVVLLLRPGEGQHFGNRAQLHLTCATRDMCDPQIWTHLCLFFATLVAANNEIYDLTTLLSLTVPLSTVYHFNFETPGIIAKAEGTLAKVMFVYGIIQMFRAPSNAVFYAEMALLGLTLLIFIGTNVSKYYYEPWHSLMHVVPAVWATVVACFHTPLIM